jgi:hypothetical protein
MKQPAFYGICVHERRVDVTLHVDEILGDFVDCIEDWPTDVKVEMVPLPEFPLPGEPAYRIIITGSFPDEEE